MIRAVCDAAAIIASFLLAAVLIMVVAVGVFGLVWFITSTNVGQAIGAVGGVIFIVVMIWRAVF